MSIPNDNTIYKNTTCLCTTCALYLKCKRVIGQMDAYYLSGINPTYHDYIEIGHEIYMRNKHKRPHIPEEHNDNTKNTTSTKTPTSCSDC